MREESTIRKTRLSSSRKAKLKKAQQILGTKTEDETIERALDKVIDENEANRRAWEANEKFVKTAIKKRLVINDVFGNLKDE